MAEKYQTNDISSMARRYAETFPRANINDVATLHAFLEQREVGEGDVVRTVRNNVHLLLTAKNQTDALRASAQIDLATRGEGEAARQSERVSVQPQIQQAASETPGPVTQLQNAINQAIETGDADSLIDQLCVIDHLLTDGELIGTYGGRDRFKKEVLKQLAELKNGGGMLIYLSDGGMSRLIIQKIESLFKASLSNESSEVRNRWDSM